MYLTIRAIVLRVTDYNDHDALLTVLTQNYGKLTIKARGLRRKNSPLIAPCQLLAFGEFTLFEYKGKYTINEAHALELFQGLRRELTQLSLGSYFAQVAELISQEDMPNPELLSLTLNALYALCRRLCTPELVKAAFELRAACLGGYTPELSGCAVCGDPEPDRFDVRGGILCCASCSAGEGLRLPVSPGSLAAMRYLVSCDAKRLFAFRLEGRAVKELCDLAETYLQTQLERGFYTLDFYKSLLMS